MAINKILGVGPVTIKKLYDHFGSIEVAWSAGENEIYGIDGISKPAARCFLDNRGRVDLDEELGLVNDRKIGIITLADDRYPANLKNIYDPPPVLYVKGDLSPADNRALAIVGTRRASRYGLETAKKLAQQLSAVGITIVSGLASGIDTAAHQGALAAGGRTLAVFGCGVDVIFPPENRGLAGEIERSGALLSEFPLGQKGEKGTFPRRNRIISGLSLGVIVVEGHYDSGALITAKEALEQGREVFAVPGSVELEQSKGPHWLIKQGAKLVESVEDVLEEFSWAGKMTNSECRMTNEGKYPELNDEEKKIYQTLSFEPKHIDNIAREAGFSSGQAAGLLMVLEVKKAVRQLPGKMFVTA
ncbi:MAG: DNA-processing protein DprA [Candidatus Saganbacteria bacterium]|nr:DNA-processing protein DprA [Candidatus Saganbacteria bacterium]